jgi:hypothetical protein
VYFNEKKIIIYEGNNKKNHDPRDHQPGNVRTVRAVHEKISVGRLEAKINCYQRNGIYHKHCGFQEQISKLVLYAVSHRSEAGAETYEQKKPGPVIGKLGLKFPEARKTIDTEQCGNSICKDNYRLIKSLTEKYNICMVEVQKMKPQRYQFPGKKDAGKKWIILSPCRGNTSACFRS